MPVLIGILAISVLGKKGPAPSANGKATGSVTITAIVTGYSVDRHQCGKTNGITSIGVNGNKIRGVAVDPTIIPYRSRIIIPGAGGELKADDTGGRMRQDARRGITHIDLRFTGKGAKKRALDWGRKKLEVTILPPVS